MDLPKLENLVVTGKRVLLRLDLDTNPDPGDLRIKSAEETLNCLKEKGASQIIILGHKGRPTPENRLSLSLREFVEPLSKITNTGVKFIESLDSFGTIQPLNHLTIYLLENLRFNPGEETNNAEFAKQLAGLGDIYINEAFASSHREHASIVALPQEFKSKSKNSVAIGVRFQKETENLSKVFTDPKRPLVFVISGLKEDKLEYAKQFETFADKVLVGGRLPELLGDKALESVRTQSGKVIIGNLVMDKEDITLNTIDVFTKEIAKAGTVVVSGPLGKFEEEGHAQGTKKVLEAVVANKNAFKVAGGGDTEDAIRLLSTDYSLQTTNYGFDWISVGGGAMLEFLTKKTLPGLEVLTR